MMIISSNWTVNLYGINRLNISTEESLKKNILIISFVILFLSSFFSLHQLISVLFFRNEKQLFGRLIWAGPSPNVTWLAKQPVMFHTWAVLSKKKKGLYLFGNALSDFKDKCASFLRSHDLCLANKQPALGAWSLNLYLLSAAFALATPTRYYIFNKVGARNEIMGIGSAALADLSTPYMQHTLSCISPVGLGWRRISTAFQGHKNCPDMETHILPP